MISTNLTLGALAPLPAVFFIGCLLGGFTLVTLYRIALWMYPSLLRAPGAMRRPLSVKVKTFSDEIGVHWSGVPEPPTSSFEEFPDPLQATELASKSLNVSRLAKNLDEQMEPIFRAHRACMDCGRTSNQLEPGNTMLGAHRAGICQFCLERRR